MPKAETIKKHKVDQSEDLPAAAAAAAAKVSLAFTTIMTAVTTT